MTKHQAAPPTLRHEAEIIHYLECDFLIQHGRITQGSHFHHSFSYTTEEIKIALHCYIGNLLNNEVI